LLACLLACLRESPPRVIQKTVGNSAPSSPRPTTGHHHHHKNNNHNTNHNHFVRPPPGEEERLEMVTMYLEKYVLNPPSSKAKPITVSGIAADEIKYAAKATVGFSGREISKLAIAWQAAAYGASGEAVLDKELYLRVLEQHLESKRKKAGWQAAAMASLEESKAQLVIDAAPSSSFSSSSSSSSSGSSKGP
jgi:hypothetical protein